MIASLKKWITECKAKGEALKQYDKLMTDLGQYRSYLGTPGLNQDIRLIDLGKRMEKLWPQLDVIQRVAIEKFTWGLVTDYQHRYLDNIARRLP